MILLDWLRRRGERLAQERAAMDAVALLSGVDERLLQEAASRVEPNRCVLVGTTALRIRGYSVDAPDFDLLCSNLPDGIPGQGEEGGSTASTTTVRIDGTKVDYIYVGRGARHASPAADRVSRRIMRKRNDIILGVPVASVKDVLTLKASAGRDKDRKFIEEWQKHYRSDHNFLATWWKLYDMERALRLARWQKQTDRAA